MKIGDLVMKLDGHIKSSPHYKMLGIIIEKNQRITSNGIADSPVVRVRWPGDYGTFWTNETSLSLVSKT
tara:strand:+ start:433 stop:639 length:207 start_codon:yes stop_codon:yes gene_type:complete